MADLATWPEARRELLAARLFERVPHNGITRLPTRNDPFWSDVSACVNPGLIGSPRRTMLHLPPGSESISPKQLCDCVYDCFSCAAAEGQLHAAIEELLLGERPRKRKMKWESKVALSNTSKALLLPLAAKKAMSREPSSECLMKMARTGSCGSLSELAVVSPLVPARMGLA